YNKMFCDNQYISLIMSNTPPAVAPWGGSKAYFGTNPISFGFPTGNDTPILIDMSTSIVARGKIRLAATNEEEIPPEWSLDRNGDNTKDPHAALKGSILPVGGPKGYALSLAIEILSGVLTGSSYGLDVKNFNDMYTGEANVGHFMMLVDITRFMP